MEELRQIPPARPGALSVYFAAGAGLTKLVSPVLHAVESSARTLEVSITVSALCATKRGIESREQSPQTQFSIRGDRRLFGGCHAKARREDERVKCFKLLLYWKAKNSC